MMDIDATLLDNVFIPGSPRLMAANLTALQCQWRQYVQAAG